MPQRKDYRRPAKATSPYGPAAGRGRGKAAIYLRLSRETEASTSPERQLEACRAKGAERGHPDIPVENVFSDIDVSAYRTSLDDRLELARLRLRWVEFDVLIFYKLDRLIRSTRDFAVLCDEADKYGCTLVSATEGAIDTDGIGKVLAQVAAIFAELEAATISLRTTSSIYHLRKHGRWRGGPRPFGLMPIDNPHGAGKVLSVVQAEAELIIELAIRVLAGESVARIASDWNRRQIPTRGKDGEWSRKVLMQIIRNPICVGQQIHHNEVLRDEDTGMPVTLHPAILELGMWQRVIAELDSRVPGWTPVPRQRLASGLMSCELCRAPLYAGGSSDRPDIAYRCTTKGRGGNCIGVSISARQMEKYLPERFLEAVGDAPFVQRIEQPAPEDLTPHIEVTREAMAAVMAERYDPYRPFTGENGDKLYAQQAMALQERMDMLLERQASLPPGGVEWLTTDRTVREEWEARDTAGRRAMLASYYETVTVKRGKQGVRGLQLWRLTITTADDLGVDAGQAVGSGQPLRAPKKINRKGRKNNAYVVVDPAREATAA